MNPNEKKEIIKKEQVHKRAEKLDPNNNINIPDNPIVKRQGKKERDDGFEHRTSNETTDPV